jgi:hypothetical protein
MGLFVFVLGLMGIAAFFGYKWYEGKAKAKPKSRKKSKTK